MARSPRPTSTQFGHSKDQADETATDIEAGNGRSERTNPFSNASVRNGFISKVYGILSFMLAVTFTVCSVCLLVKPVRTYIHAHPYIYFIAVGVYLLTVLPLICCQSLGRAVPWNYLLLSLVTLSTAVMVGVICAFHSLVSVLLAAGTTFIIVTIVSLFSCTTKFDFTKWIWIVGIVTLAFFIFSFAAFLVCRFATPSGQEPPILQLVIGGIGVIIFTIYLAIDTQLICGGRRYQISTEDYVYGALSLYLDIINIFLYLLMILGASRRCAS